MGVNLIQKGRKIYSVPASAAILKGSIREILANDARMIDMVIRNLDEANTVTLKPQESNAKTSGYVDLAAGAVGTSASLGSTQGDTLALPPLGRGTMRFSVGKRYWAVVGSGGPALIEVHEMAQDWSPTEGHGDQS